MNHFFSMENQQDKDNVSSGEVGTKLAEESQAVVDEVVKPELSEEVEGKTEPKSSPSWFKRPLLLLVVTLVVVVLGVAFWGNRDSEVAVKKFTNVYAFVPEKISKSAVIPINVPEGVDEASARASISFSPEVQGTWKTEEIEKVVVFEPSEPLRLGVYYAVNMDTGTVQMSGDFYVDEDPQVEAIFPSQGSESHEDTEITIVFNRPMVPLTTLSLQEEINLPISVTPATPGKFKWISTRNLQFVPATTLMPSTDYRVEIKDGLYSIDGLPVAPITHTFVTRPLRYEYLSNDQVGYRSPIVVVFNQPVDIDKTKDQISVSKLDGDKVAIDVTYGETTYYDRSARKYVTEKDPSKLFVYQRKDAHGRKQLWDFDTTYSVAIGGAKPLSGTKSLEIARNSNVSVPNIVQDIRAESERSTLVRPDLLDPRGTVIVTFYEDVDKESSVINVKGLREIVYGERCKTDEYGQEIWLGNGCEMEADKRNLILSFNPDVFSTDESFNLELKKVKTPDGFIINAEPINLTLKTYPTAQILRTFPQDQAAKAELDGMYVCTNVPLEDPGDDGLSSYVKTEGYIVYGRWSWSRYLDAASTYNHCNVGEFETNLRYGLLPETDYKLRLALTDEFGQTAERELMFRTMSPLEKYTRFHNLQKQYNVTPPERTKLTYAVENLEYVNLHICRLEPELFLERTVNQADSTDPPRSDGCSQVISEKISLPVRYWVNNYFQINLADYFADTRGHYIITFGHPLYTTEVYEENGNPVIKPAFDRTYVSVTNLAIGKKEIEYTDDAWSISNNPAKNQVLDRLVGDARNLYWVNNSQSLAPIAGATIVQYRGSNGTAFIKQASNYTNAEGIARLSVERNLAGAVIRSGLDSAVITDWSDTIGNFGETRDASRTYVYTDRPIYRPGHTVNIRGIDRIGFDGTYEVWNKDEVKLEIYDSRDVKVYETNLEQNDYGTFNTNFELPGDAPLGSYRIVVFGQNFYFDVEEYVPAAFKLNAESNQEEYLNGDIMKLEVQADYYFGVPLNEGTVSYSVTAQDYYFDRYTDEYFNFGQDWYYCYFCGYGDDFLFRGETAINEDGAATILRELNLADFFDDIENEGSKLVTVFITAKDTNGRSVSTQKSFIVHKGEFYIGAKTDQYYTSVATPLTLRVKTVDTKGLSMPLSDIDRKVYKVNWETFKRQEVDGGFYYQSEKKMVEISSDKIKTDDKGDWSGPLSFAEEGEYEIHVSKTDNRGNKITTIANVYIYGEQSVSVPPNNNYELDLEVERTSLKVGDTASLLIKSPYDNAKVLISVERGTIYDYWITDVKGGLYLHEFPIKSEYAPNIFVSALLLSGDPEVKYGSVRYDIGTEEHELDVKVTPNKTNYLPGEEVTLKVETRDNTGLLVPAEVSVAVADLSVLALKGNPKKNPAVFFYDGFPLSVTTASNIKNILYEVDIPLGTKGGGGASPDDLAKKKRGLFKDTAFWQASVVTDSSGQATVSFTLPDNLTTWQIESLGVTKDTKLGVDYKEFTTKKDLMAVPQKPRFIVPGDTFSLGAKVFNQTDQGTTVDVKLKSDTLVFSGKQEASVFINQGESKTVYFDVTAPTEVKAGSHTFTFTASSESFEDSVEQVIPVTPNTTFETVATANFTKDDQAVEYLYVPNDVVSGDGGLTINANATMAVFMNDALTYMVTYPYGCSEQLASSLGTIGTLKKALTLPNVEGSFDTIDFQGATYTVDDVVATGLSSLYEAQSSDGGFAYYKGLPANLYLTLHVVEALDKLKAAGYEVREDVQTRGAAYIESKAQGVYRNNPAGHKETVILAEYILHQVSDGKSTALTNIVETLIDDKAFLNEKISSLSLAYLAILTADNYSRSRKNLVYDTLKNRIDIDGRGAYLKTMGTTNYDYYETSIKDTALLLKAFAAHQDEHPAMGNVLRWLLASRDKNGVWGGTQNTFAVVDAMIAYLEWQHETESHYSLKGLLDGVEIFGFEFNPSTVFKTFTHYIPIDDLKREKLLPLVFNRESKNGQKSNFYYDMTLKYFLPVEALPPRDEGITITRSLYKLDDTKNETPLQSIAVGEVVRGKITLTIPDEYRSVAIEDYIPAGFEIVNFNLDTEDQSLLNENNNDEGEWMSNAGSDSLLSRLGDYFGGSLSAQVFQPWGIDGSYDNDSHKLYPTHIESHDDRVFVYVERLGEGVYEYEYFLRALVPGKFQRLPARAEELFFPEVFGRTSGEMIEVTPVK